jgi:hypothetical protein
MSEVAQDRPNGLGSSAEFKVVEGPHSYTEDMQRLALQWFSEHLGTRNKWVDSVPALDLNTGDVDADAMSIVDLPLPGSRPWKPSPTSGEVLRTECSGRGPTVLLLGAMSDPSLLHDAGFRTCAVWPVVPPGGLYNELAWSESIGRGLIRVDALAGGVQQVADREQATLIWAHRGWGLVAAATGIQFVVYQPILSVDQIDPTLDAPWVHVPGAWDGAIKQALNLALKKGGERQHLVKALQESQE